ncbi:MAG: hypothetical protein RL630_271 [Verrucomicrobiota bacterium]|jgi:autotransporter-associated beta strand protein
MKNQSLFAGLLLALAVLLLPETARAQNPLAVPIIFDNQTGLDPSQIFIQFMGGHPVGGHYTNALSGNTSYLSGQPNQFYSLAQIQGLGTFNATTNSKGVSVQYANSPGILLDDLPSGRIYLNFGTQGLINPGSQPGYTPPSFLSSDPNYNTRWQYIEATVKNGQIWADLSYIDFTSISFNLTANASGAGNNDQISAPAFQLANSTLQSATSNAASLPIQDPLPPLLPPEQQFTRIISPQYTVGNNQTVYGNFTSYLGSLNNTNATVSGFFAGVGGELGAPTTAAQIYEYTANFNGTDGNGTVTLVASPKSGTTFGAYGNGSIVPVPKGNSLNGAGNNTITLKYSDLIAPTGIYGSNPAYQVSGTFTQNNTGIVNDVFGRVVGDLLAGLTFGTFGSNVTANLSIGNGTTTTLNGTIGSLPSSVWWGAGESTDFQYVPVNGTIYTVSWKQSLAGSSNGTLLYGGAQPTGSSKETPYYNYYSAALVGGNYNINTALTPGYGTPFGDRIGNNLLTFTINGTGQAFMVLTINADTGTPNGGNWTYTPIPASVWTGGNGTQWTHPSNWSSNNLTHSHAVPNGNSTIQFLGTPGSLNATTVDVGGNRDVAAISFRYGAQPFILKNGTITLNGYTQNVPGLGNVTSVGANIINSSLQPQTIQNDLVFTTNGTLAAVSANLTLSGNIATSGLLANAGGNTTTLSGNVSGNGGFSQVGTGTLALLGANNSFTGGVSISSGTIALGSNGAAGSGDITFAGGTLAAQGGGNYSFANNLVLNGNATVAGQGSLAFNGNTTFGNSTTFTANAPVSLNGAFSPAGANSQNFTFTVAGNSSLTLGGSSPSGYNGSFAVTSGTLNLAKTGNATSVFNNLTIGGAGSPATVLVSTPNQIQLTSYPLGGGNFTSPAITIFSGGTLALGSNSLNLSTTTANTSASLIFYGGNATGNGTISTFGNTATIQFIGTGNSTAAINNNFSLQNSTLTGNLAGNFTAFNVDANDAPAQLIVTGDISGPGGLSKGDAGTLWLQGNNTYAGGTSLAGGVLAASSLGNGSVSFAGGGLSPGGLGQTGNLTVKGISFNNGFILSTLATNNSSDFLGNTGSFSNQKGNKILFVFESASTPAGNFTYTLARDFDPTAGNYTYASANIPGLVGNFTYTSGNLIFSGAAGVNATWSGATSDSWAIGTNWQSSAVPAPGADILFGTATNHSVDTAANQTTGSITFLAGAQAYTVSNNTITLGGDLTNNSAATQTVTSNLTINWDRSFNAAFGNLVLANIDLGTQIRVNTATFNAAANRTITISGNLTDDYIVTASEALPAGNIVKTGSGTLLVTGSLAHHGTTTIEQGMLAANGTIGDLTQPSQTPTLVFSGGTLRAAGNITTSYTGSATYRQAIVLEETGIFDTNGNTITLDSGITGPGGITKTGAGILILTTNATASALPASLIGSGAYQGNLTITAGQVQMNANQNLGPNSTVFISGNGALSLSSFTGNAITNNFTLNGAGDPSLGGALFIDGANTEFSGTITLNGNSTISSISSSPTFTGTVSTANNTILYTNVLDGGTLSLQGAISGNGGLGTSSTHNGTLSLGNATNTYNGSTILNSGTLLIQAASNLPSGPGGHLLINNNATLTLTIASATEAFDWRRNLQLSGTGFGNSTGAIRNTAGANKFSGNTTLNGNTTLYIDGGSLEFAGPVSLGAYALSFNGTSLPYIPLTISGNLSGSGNINLGSSQQLALSGDNSAYNGTFSLGSAAVLQVSGNNGLGTATQNFTQASSSLQIFGGITLGNNITTSGSIVNLSGDNFLPNLLSTGAQTIYSKSGTIHIGGNFSNSSSVLTSGTAGFNGTVATIGSNFSIHNIQLAGGYFSPGGAGTRQNLALAQAGWAGGTLVLDLASGNLSDSISLPNPIGAMTTGVFFNDDFGDQGFVGNQTYTLFSADSGTQVNAPTNFTTNIRGLSGNFSNNATLIQFTTGATPVAATWSGNTSGSWSTGSNWLAGTSPAAGAAITFTGNKNISVDTIADRSTGTITFAPGASSFTISNNTLTIGGRITNNSGVTQTITSNLTYIGSGKSILAQFGDLVLGNIAMAPMMPQNLALTFNGSSNTTVNGSITQNSNGTASLVKNGTGTLTLAGNSSYTGATTVNSGTLLVTGALGSTPVTIASGAALGGVGSIGGNITFAAGSNLVFSSSGLSLTGPETLLSFGNFSVANILDLPSTTGNQSFTLFVSSTGLNNPAAHINTANLQNPYSNKYTLSDGRLAWFSGSNATADFSGLHEHLFLNITGGSTPPVPSSLYWVGSNGTSWLAAENWSASSNATVGSATLATNGTQSVIFASTGANATTTASTTLGANATITQLVVTTSQSVAIGGSGILTISGNLATAIAIESAAGNVSITTPVVLAGNATTISVNGTSPTVSIATIGGSNGLTKTGDGTLTLTGTSTYSGGTTISGGTLAISSASITGNITNNAALAFNQTTNGTFSGNISGTGSVTKSGAGTLTLNGTNTHSGSTTIASGALVSGNLSNSILVLQSGAAYSPGAVNTIDTISVAGITLNGGDLLYNLGNGTNDRINASGNAILNGHVVFDFSNLGYAAGNFTVLTGNGVSSFDTANLSYNAVGNFTLSGNFVKSGNSLLFVTAAPPPPPVNYTWTGGAGNGSWNAAANWITPPVPGALVYFAGSTETNVDTDTNQSIGGIVFNAGAGNFTISNNTITLAGNVENDSTNTQTINSTITLAKNITFAADSGNLAFGGAIAFGANSTFLTVTGSSDTAISGAISGSGSLLKRGTGNLTLSGSNTFTGNTTIQNGNLIVQGGAALADAGTVTLANSNATFTVAASETIGSLLGSGTASVAVNQTLTVAQTGSATFNGTLTGAGVVEKSDIGTLTLAGTSNHTGGTIVSAGTLAGTTASLQDQITNNATLVFNQATDGTYNGTLTGTGDFQKTGNGTLSLTGSTTQGNYFIQHGVLAVTSGNALGGGDTTVSNGAQLDVIGTNLTLGNLTIAGTGIYGNGSLMLFNNTLLNATVALSSNATIGSVSSGFLQGDITGSNTTLTLYSNSGGSGEILGAISLGSGGIVKTGGGYFGLSGNNTYTGGIQIDAGTLGGNVASLKGDISNNGTLSFESLPANSTFANTISGTGAVAINSVGNLTLSGNNTYTGSTTVNGGAVLLVTGSLGTSSVTIGNTSAIGGNGTLGGNLTFAAGSNLVYDPAASLTVNGAAISFGNFSLSNLSGFNGSTASLGNSALLGGSAVVNTANLQNLGAANSQTFGSNEAYFYTGTGGKNLNLAVVQVSADLYWVGSNGTDWFTANNWSNNASATTGDATFGPSSEDIHFASSGANATTLANTNLSQNATVRNLIVSTPQNVGVGGSGSLTLNGSTGTGMHLTSTAGNVTFTVPIVVSGGSDIQIDGGTLEVASLNGTAVHIGTAAGTSFAYNTGSNLTFDGTITGAGAFAKRGNGTLTLTGHNSYSGGTTISAGTLAGTTASLQGNILNKSALSFNQATDGTYAGVISGTGSLAKTGAGVLTLSGNNSYSGGTTISAGTLAGNTASLQGNILNNAALSFNQATDGTYAGNISGTGSLNKTGAGALALSGTNTYTGGTTLSAGSTQALSSRALGNGSLTLSGGSLVVGDANTANLAVTGITNLVWTSANSTISLAHGGNITASANFTDGGNTGNRTFDLGSGKYLQKGSNTLVSFGNNTTFSASDFIASFSANNSHTGTFQIVGNSLVFNLSNGTSTGNIIDNWAGPDTPTWVDFQVNGANGTVYSEVPVGRNENTIAGLIFLNNGNLVIQQNTTLNVTGGVMNVQNGSSVVSGGTLATPGNFNKTGSGELDVQSAFVVGGTASIDAGLLSVNSQLTAGSVVVNPGGTLGGNGTLIAAGGMTISGTLSPGNSPGVISIVSNPVWTSSATTLLEIASPSNYDRIVVTGTAQVAGTLNIVNFGGNDSLAYGQQYPFLTATGGITGDFDTITAPATFRGRFLNQGTTGTILIAPDTYTRVAVTPNQRNVAKALDGFIPAKSGDRMVVSTALDLQTAAQYPNAFNQIMPGFYETLPDIVIEQAYTQTQLLNQRLSSVRLGAQGFQYIGIKEQPLKNDRDGKSTASPKSVSPIVEAPTLTNWNSWVMGVGEFSNTRGSGVPNYKNSAGGFLAGADYRFSENFSSGVFAGYQYNYAKSNGGGSTRGNSALFGLYATYKNEDGYYADSVIGGGYTGFQTRRPIKFSTIDRTASADPGTGQFNAAINLGKDWTIDKFVVGPLLGLQYTYAGTAGFSESNADSLDLAVGSQNNSSLRSSLGGRVAYIWDIAEGLTLIPEVRAQWMHEFLNDSTPITSRLDGGTGASFGYETADPYRDSIFGGVGVSAKIGENMTGSIFYNVNFGSSQFLNNIISVDFGLAF